jgi:hypothetical protein
VSPEQCFSAARTKSLSATAEASQSQRSASACQSAAPRPHALFSNNKKTHPPHPVCRVCFYFFVVRWGKRDDGPTEKDWTPDIQDIWRKPSNLNSNQLLHFAICCRARFRPHFLCKRQNIKNLELLCSFCAALAESNFFACFIKKGLTKKMARLILLKIGQSTFEKSN